MKRIQEDRDGKTTDREGYKGKKNRSETIGPKIEKWTKDRLNKLGCSGN